jgi:Zn-dependent peptidase ImmA (M78 family)/DNA-binding XRE family transcriptional regulator
MRKENLRQINPKMIVLGRESREITQKELADILSITQGKMSKIENGLISVSKDELNKISHTLKYPQHFFIQTEQIYGPGISELYHRMRKEIPIRILKKAHAVINVLIMHMDRLLKSADIGNLDIYHMDIDENGSPENIAQMARATWRLPPGPIENVITIIENAGGIIIPCNFETNKIDAISIWIPKLPPLFFININTPTDRLRFSLCHELGHIVMHKIPNADMERQADRFAAEFLTPAKEIRPSLDNLNLEKLAALKQYWKVSMSSFIYHAKSLNKITENQARYLYMQLGRLGYRTWEPFEPPKEQPRLFYELFQFHLSNLNYTLPQLSELLALEEDEMKSLYINQEKHLRLVK